MDTLKEFQSLSTFRPALKFSDLKLNTQYPIVSVERLLTKYGIQTKCKLMVNGVEEAIFLPSRYSMMSDQMFESLNSSNHFCLVVVGPMGRSWELKLEISDALNSQLY